MDFTKKIAQILMCVLCVISLVGCGKKEQEEPAMVVYKYGDAIICYGEFYVYAKTIEEDYQKIYGNGIWSLELTTDDGKSSVRDVTIRDLVHTINRVKVLVDRAQDMDLTLADEEKQEAEEAGTKFFEGLTEKDIRDTGLTKQMVVTIIEENMLAEKVYNQVIADYDFEISEEEARMTTFYDVVFECYDLEKDGSVSEYTEEKKATQLERANEALKSLAQEEEASIDAIVEKYDLQYSGQHTMSRTELAKEYGENIADKILTLSDGEISSVIPSEYGYHIFKMIQSKDEELTKKNKSDIISQMKKDYFNGIYEDWAHKYDSHFRMTDVNYEMIQDFPFSVTK